MGMPVKASAVRVNGIVRELDGALLVQTRAGYMTPEAAGITLDYSDDATSQLGPPIWVPPGSKGFVLKSVGKGGIGDKLKAVRVVPMGTGTATQVKLTDGDGSPYPDPEGTDGLIANPFNKTPICGNGLTAPVDIPMYDQPSYSGAYSIDTPDDAGALAYGTFA